GNVNADVRIGGARDIDPDESALLDRGVEDARNAPFVDVYPASGVLDDHIAVDHRRSRSGKMNAVEASCDRKPLDDDFFPAVVERVGGWRGTAGMLNRGFL